MMESLWVRDATCTHKKVYSTPAGYICDNPQCGVLLNWPPYACPHENYDFEDNFCYDCALPDVVTPMPAPWLCVHDRVTFMSGFDTYICNDCGVMDLDEDDISEDVRLKARAIDAAVVAARSRLSSDSKDPQLHAQKVLLDGIDRKVEPWNRTGLLESLAVLIGHMDGYMNAAIAKDANEERVSGIVG